MPGLIGIGVGPGDPELLTVKAVKAIQNADIIMCPASNEDRPSIALSLERLVLLSLDFLIYQLMKIQLTVQY